MEVGLAKGLAQSMQYDQRMQDERWYEEQMQRAKDRNLAELNAFEKDLEYMNAANSYDRGLIKAEADKTIKEIGALVGQNPDWRYNPDVRRQINEKKKYLKSNEHVLRGMASDDAFNRLNKDLAEVAKNPEFRDTAAYQNLLRQKQNYLQYGHQEGLEGLKRDGGPQSFVYTKPRDFRDLNKDFASIGNEFKDVLQKGIKGGGQGAYQEYANPETLGIIANQYYSQNKTQLDQEAAKVNMDPLKYTMKGIDAHIKKQRHEGDHSLSNAIALRQYDEKMERQSYGNISNSPTTWETEIARKDYGKENGDVFDQVFGKNYNYDVNGIDGSKANLSGYETKHTGFHKKAEVIGPDGKKRTQKFVEVYTDIPESVSKEKGFTYDPWGIGDNDISDNYKNNVSKYTKEGKDGKQIEITRVKTWVPVDVNNQAFRGRYNQMNMANKFQQAPLSNKVGDKPTSVFQNGIEYVLNPQTGQYE